ncbi:MAG: SUMF1/EgtB/PvdO family nonheme iron enzyme [Zavarzinella sp.]
MLLQHIVDTKVKPGDVCQVKIFKNVCIAFCYIPQGELQLGSSDEEISKLSQFLKKKNITPDHLFSEANRTRGKYTSNGYWLAMNELSIADWKQVMTDDNYERKLPTDEPSKYPITGITYASIQRFLKKCDPPAGFVLRLPTEDEWEYAYFGLQKKRPYYWGSELTGKEANCFGNSFDGDECNRSFGRVG